MKKALLLCAFIWGFNNTYSQPGQLDEAFGDKGEVLNYGHGAFGSFEAIAIQQEKIVVIDNWRGVLCRYNLNGSPDSSFGIDGEQPAIYAYGMAIQDDGKIVLVGDNAVFRYHADGLPDKTFNHTGKQVIDFGNKYNRLYAVAIQDDGKIVVAGASYDDTASLFALARFNSNGSPDSTFSGDGKEITAFDSDGFARSMVIQADGKIIVTGGKNIARYNTNGSLDTSFDLDGKSTMDFNLAEIALQSDGKIILVGSTFIFSNNPSDFVIARLNADGKPDHTFNQSGKQFTRFNNGNFDEQAYAVAVQPNGKILVGGYGAYKRRSAFALARYKTDGSLDTAFGTDGLQQTFSSGSSAYYLKDIVVFKNRLYAAGANYGMFFEGSQGVIVSYHLEESSGTTVQFTDPAYNHNFYTGPATIPLTVEVSAADTGVSISKVEIYNGAELLSADSVRPYHYVWKSVPVGEYLLTAKAIVNNHVVATSSLVRASVLSNQPPAIEITFPDFDYIRHFSAPLNLLISANAYDQDPDGTISRVDFYDGAILLYTDSSSPYTFNWENVPVGMHSITATAFDKSGSFTSSYEVKITVDPNTAPLAYIKSPLNDSYFPGPLATINIEAEADDGYGKVSRVEFYNGATLLGTDSTYPYSFTWQDVPAGEYTVKAKAIDNSGLTGLSTPIHIFVVFNLPPVVKITSPVASAIFKETATIFLYARATDPDGSIKKVEFYEGNRLIGTEMNHPFSRFWKHVPAGNYIITARATDNEGRVAISAPVNIIVLANIRPEVQIISPLNNATFVEGDPVQIQIVAKDTDGIITRVDVYNGLTLLASERQLPYTYTWRGLPAGNYIITARAKDNNDGITTSLPVSFSVLATGTLSLSGRPGMPDYATGKVDPVNFTIAPNPVKDILHIYTGGFSKNMYTEIYVQSSSGVTLKKIRVAGSSQMIPLNVSSLSGGVYLVKGVSGSTVRYARFVKIK